LCSMPDDGPEDPDVDMRENVAGMLACVGG
jgi:hypothetical protein